MLLASWSLKSPPSTCFPSPGCWILLSVNWVVLPFLQGGREDEVSGLNNLLKFPPALPVCLSNFLLCSPSFLSILSCPNLSHHEFFHYWSIIDMQCCIRFTRIIYWLSNSIRYSVPPTISVVTICHRTHDYNISDYIPYAGFFISVTYLFYNWKFVPFFFLMFSYFWERERDRARVVEGAERETQNSKQAAGSELSAQSPRQGWNLQTGRPLPELKSDAQLTEPPRRPWKFVPLKSLFSQTPVGLSSSRLCAQIGNLRKWA